MSPEVRGATALAPAPRPELAPEPHERHLRAVGLPAVRRRIRPRPVHGLIVLGGIGVILLAQLMLSISVAESTYRIAELQQTEKNLVREESALREQLATLESPQNLAADAEALGMRASGSMAYLDLDSGRYSGAQSGGRSSVLGSSGEPIANSLLDDSTPISGVGGESEAADLASGWSSSRTAADSDDDTDVSAADDSGATGTLPSTSSD